jgi:hypothetical protein
LIEFQLLTVTAKTDIMKVEPIVKPVIVNALPVVAVQPTVVLVSVLLIDQHTLTANALPILTMMVLTALNAFTHV